MVVVVVCLHSSDVVNDMSTIMSAYPGAAAALGLGLRRSKQRWLLCSASASGNGNGVNSEQMSRGIRRREATLVVSTGIWLANMVVSVPASQAAKDDPTIELLSQCKSLTIVPSGLAFCDLVIGAGSQPIKGQLIKAHYVGRFENGTVFDSSYNRGKPLTFRVGVGEVIQGWDQGILGSDGVPPMLPGGKRKLKVPPELAYGIRGAGCKAGSCIIPPNSTLLFDVEFIGKA
ncbi:peptidyl-prolyl cis-trans isomerase FKBP13, chloroplastic-like [Dioscorea cayenensis subsp. rotundata]|uniref:peptidylprolyl isomerase n=1 Tax=Dioscorea cayennensis subsp. rotundata TaxID=55577 RepID=A0AB40AH50_DIOCR|nr:peptidyl-prolyl cis-trans isomerase FKBP13, chloroplastic-like [Dioscorea cayenensis subsp. rotundata]